MSKTLSNTKTQSTRESEFKMAQVEPLMLPGLKVGESEGANFWAFRYDESEGRLSRFLACPNPHTWQFEEIGGHERDIVLAMGEYLAYTIPENSSAEKTAAGLFNEVYKRTLDIVNGLGEMWISPDYGRHVAIAADFVVDALSPYQIGLVSRFVREAIELPVVFVDEYIDGQYMGEPSGPRWLRLGDEDLKPVPELIKDGFAPYRNAGADKFVDCNFGGYPLERAFGNMCAVIEWWGRELGCRAEAFGVACAAQSVRRWLCYDVEFSSDALRELSRRVQRLDDAAQEMAVAILRVQDRRAAENERADTAGAVGQTGKRRYHVLNTAYGEVKGSYWQVYKYYFDNRQKVGRRIESCKDFWERCRHNEITVSGATMKLGELCSGKFENFERMCENGRRRPDEKKQAGSDSGLN